MLTLQILGSLLMGDKESMGCLRKLNLTQAQGGSWWRWLRMNSPSGPEKTIPFSMCSFAPGGCFPGSVVLTAFLKLCLLCTRAVGSMTGPTNSLCPEHTRGKLSRVGAGPPMASPPGGRALFLAPHLDLWSRSHQGKLMTSLEELLLTRPSWQIAAFPRVPFKPFQ